MITGQHYLRRCRECLRPKGNERASMYPLPPLKKKVVYLDQFAISNLMNALNPATKAHQKGVDEFWLRLFERLDSLIKMQLLVCPSSDFHDQEPVVAGAYQALKRMCELLSQGADFKRQHEIQGAQISQHARNWIRGEADSAIVIDVDQVIDGEINAWQNHFYVSVTLPQAELDKWAEGLRQVRDKTSDVLDGLVSRWQSETNRTFEDWFDEETMAFGKESLAILSNPAARLKGWADVTPQNVFRLPLFHTFVMILNVFRSEGVSEQDLKMKIFEYVVSPSWKTIPFNRINGMLIAAVARQCAFGGRKKLDRGMMNDTSMISTLLPYCDAMFIDKACHNLLKEKPLRDEIDYGTRIFSLNNKAELLDYLDAIEAGASKEHLAAVQEVYGDDWRQPYVTLYQNRSESAAQAGSG